MVQPSLLSTLPSDPNAGKLEQVDQSLRNRFAPPKPRKRLDPLSQMILSMLGVRTLGYLSISSFATLRASYDGWAGVRDAPEMDVFTLIREVTFPDLKARRIQLALTLITEKCGELSLDFLADMPVDDALAWLETLPGVGRKVAAATLNFSTLNRPAAVIDTHHERILKRLGLIGDTASTITAYEYVMTHIPNDWTGEDIQNQHYFLNLLGQQMCFASIPVCNGCPLRNICKRGGEIQEWPSTRKSLKPSAQRSKLHQLLANLPDRAPLHS